MSDTEHSRFGPSKMQSTIACPGARAMESTCRNSTSKYAAEGTAAHQLLEWAIDDGKFYAAAYKGRIIRIVEGKGVHTKRFEFTVDEDMIDNVQIVLDKVLKRVDEYKLLGAVKVTIFSETRFDFSHIVGVPGQFGTADIVVIAEFADGTARMAVEDLKYGQGVRVFAKDNPQLKTYGLAAFDFYTMVYDIKLIDVAIHQPRLNHYDEDTLTAAELQSFAPVIHAAVQKAQQQLEQFEINRDAKKLDLVPGEKQCKFCNAKAKCPAFVGAALKKVVDDFDDLDEIKGDVIKKRVADKVEALDDGTISLEELAAINEAADMIDDLLKAVRGRIEAELLQSANDPEVQAVLRHKIVQGKKGNRAWKVLSAAEDLMKSMRLKQDQMYNMKLISPAQAETLLKNNQRRWSKLADLITQPPGQPSVAPISDKRPALVIKPVSEDFVDLDDTDNNDMV